jgi:uncharacterized membrane protein
MRAWTDEQIERIMSVVLIVGVMTAAATVLAGGLGFLYLHGDSMPDYRVCKGEPADLRSIPGILADVRSLSSRGVIQLGLLLLIATPVMRVMFAAVAFLVQRDRVYVLVTLLVLAVLLYSLTGGGLPA